jgi:hypothetical protein
VSRRSKLAVAAIACTALTFSGCVAIVALSFGWHPVPNTSLGCALHTHFHEGATDYDAASTLRGAECLVMSIGASDYVLREKEGVSSVSRWLNARRAGWGENVLHVYASPSTGPFVTLRGCAQDPEKERVITVSRDWLGVTRGKDMSRPICPEEGAELRALFGVK